VETEKSRTSQTQFSGKQTTRKGKDSKEGKRLVKNWEGEGITGNSTRTGGKQERPLYYKLEENQEYVKNSKVGLLGAVKYKVVRGTTKSQVRGSEKGGRAWIEVTEKGDPTRTSYL